MTSKLHGHVTSKFIFGPNFVEKNGSIENK